MTSQTESQTTPAAHGFDGLGLLPNILNRLTNAGFHQPTPIQAQSIPIAVEGKDLIGIAQTGTGKTLAFSLPMIQRLAKEKGRGLILLPTRELALQVDETLQRLLNGSKIRTAVLIGGAGMGPQKSALARDPHIIVATPGRLIDHLEQRTLKLDTVKVLVLDEADRMLDMGFAPQINKILAGVPKVRQTLLFSATMPEQIAEIAKKYMDLPVRVEIARAGTTAENVTQDLYIVGKMDKPKPPAAKSSMISCSAPCIRSGCLRSTPLRSSKENVRLRRNGCIPICTFS
jgi:ATP-dependent RNA helicase RhlE